jgi:hypothetical protein
MEKSHIQEWLVDACLLSWNTSVRLARTILVELKTRRTVLTGSDTRSALSHPVSYINPPVTILDADLDCLVQLFDEVHKTMLALVRQGSVSMYMDIGVAPQEHLSKLDTDNEDGRVCELGTGCMEVESLVNSVILLLKTWPTNPLSLATISTSCGTSEWPWSTGL